MSDTISELADSSVSISVSTFDSKTILYSSGEIPGSEFKPNLSKTKYKHKVKSPEKHIDTLIPEKNKILCNIKKATIGDISDSTNDIRIQITIGSITYETLNTWRVVKDNNKKIKLFFKQ